MGTGTLVLVGGPPASKAFLTPHHGDCRKISLLHRIIQKPASQIIEGWNTAQFIFFNIVHTSPPLLLLPPSFVLNSQVANFLEGCCKKRINVYCNKNRQNRRTSVEIYISNILNNLDNSTLKEPFCVNLMTTSSQFYVKRSLLICNIFSPEVLS